MVDVLCFQEALKISGDAKRHLLLGNGFSIAWNAKVFTYKSLLESADFSRVPDAQALFDALGTTDFEEVIRHLLTASKLAPCYVAGPVGLKLQDKMRADADALKEILVAAIAGNHPDTWRKINPEAFRACRAFLRNFTSFYTLNYDLLLYWTLMRDDVDDGPPIRCDDGFTDPDDVEDAEYVVWEGGGSACVHFLHGALHLYDAGTELQKRTWSRTAVPLMDQIRSALDAERYPLFVAEGESEQKLRKIQHHGYLSRALRSFSGLRYDLFIFGHSLAPNDEHVLRRIERGKVGRVFVSLYGGPEGKANKAIIARAQAMVAARPPRRPLEVRFYDAESARVWG